MEPYDKRVYRALLIGVVVLLGGGMIFYHYVEGFSWVDAYYFCVVTLATVGYGDIVPHTDLGKIFTTFYIIFGVGLLATFITYNFRRTATNVRRRRHLNDNDDNASQS